MKKIILNISIVLIVFFISGCSHKHTGVNYPDHNIHEVGKVYIECNTYEKAQFPLVCGDITDEVALLGFDVSKGKKEKAPKDSKVILSYTDKWYWDMSMYMLSLEIIVRDKETNDYIAESFVERTSLIRKNTKEMAREALSEIIFHTNIDRKTYMNEAVHINPSIDISSIKKIYIMSTDNTNSDLKIQKYLKRLGFQADLGHKKYYTKDIDAVLSLNKNYSIKYLQLRSLKNDYLIAQVKEKSKGKNRPSQLEYVKKM